MTKLKKKKVEKMLTVKVKFNFEGIKHEAQRSVFPEYIGKEVSFIGFLNDQFNKVYLKWKRQRR